MIVHIPMVPVPKGRPRMTRSGHVYTPQTTHDAENVVRGYIKRAWDRPPLLGAVGVSMIFWLPKPKTVKRSQPTGRPDADNLAKLVMDAANRLLWQDDAQIVNLQVSKHYCSGGGEPGIDLEVVALDTP